MTNQEKKEWLNQYREAEAEAVRLEQEIARWYSRAERMTVAVKLVPGGGEGGRQIESAVEAVDSLAGELGEQRRATVALRRGIEDAIAAVPDGRLRQLLRYRYIDGMTFERIAVTMDMSYQWVCHLHGAALEKLSLN